ncbi:transcription antitermination factor NusB [Dorea acetigenes]|uniref:Transcription antitermination protein NusB n=1 Tax=Dorea acetigenes TaxID=2981787 RepID=A0ABT2RQ37_9FIRM|nr:transcription antitermination factor NusB [Dorea acetigenes]MCU6687485.1 transcription antitermination factor NusB [Dorea acetigenes]SCJ43935.1 N utilization substance protein B homolog [uncultured Clostridium sp.]
MKRSELREHIFKVLFGLEFVSPEEMPGQLQLYFGQLEDIKEKDRAYIQTKALAVAEHLEDIDALLNASTTGWKTGRMNKVDLTILRLAVYEMKWDDDVPVSVAINEAVVLAKQFGGDDSSAFVNGVLAKIV